MLTLLLQLFSLPCLRDAKRRCGWQLAVLHLPPCRRSFNTHLTLSVAQSVNLSLDPGRFGANKVSAPCATRDTSFSSFFACPSLPCRTRPSIGFRSDQQQGFGFITFSTPAAAANFCTQPPSVSISGRKKLLFTHRLEPPSGLIACFPQAPSCSGPPSSMLHPHLHPRARPAKQPPGAPHQGEAALPCRPLHPPSPPATQLRKAQTAAGKNQLQVATAKGNQQAEPLVAMAKIVLSPRQDSEL